MKRPHMMAGRICCWMYCTRCGLEVSAAFAQGLIEVR